MSAILDIRNLSLAFDTGAGAVQALRNVSLRLPRGAIVGVVGESGSGKSTLSLAIMRLLPGNARIAAGGIDFCGADLLALPESRMRDLRGRRIAMVFQDPMTSLNPVRSIGQQMTDIQHHDPGLAKAEKRRRAAAALARVGIPDAAHQLGNYPFQFSGGMRQRIAIAMAMLQNPDVLIADEVTTALDVTLEAQILHLLRELRDETGCAVLFISHNLGAVAEICDSVVVLYAGEVVEEGPVASIFANPRHPYTQALIACDPARIAAVSRELPVIPGEVPNLARIPEGCVFAPRCPAVSAICRAAPPPAAVVAEGHLARCVLATRETAL